MGNYDRDWYRKENRSRRKYNKPKHKINPYVMIFLMLMLMFALFPFVGRFCDYSVTITLILVNCLIFILIKLNKLNTRDLCSSYRSVVGGQECYRVVSSAFTHEEPLHIICNMGSLYNLGVVLEPRIGSGVFFGVYVFIMLVGGSFSVWVHKKRSPFANSIGASGVICGLLGVYIAIAVKYSGIRGVTSVLPSLAIMILMTASKKIDSIGHFTGLITGIVCGVILMNIGA